jgi:hypothetical protein
LENFMRQFGVALAAASLFITGALAEPLKPGYPSGVKAARATATSTAIMLGTGALILAGVGFLVSGPSAPLDPLVIKNQGLAVAPSTTG